MDDSQDDDNQDYELPYRHALGVLTANVVHQDTELYVRELHAGYQEHNWEFHFQLGVIASQLLKRLSAATGVPAEAILAEMARDRL